MKLAILSDFHLGYEKTSEDTFKQAQSALEAASKKADALLILGDVFDDPAPTEEAKSDALKLFQSMAGKGWKAKVISTDNAKGSTSLPIIAIAGNHENRETRKGGKPLASLRSAGLIVELDNSIAVIENGSERVAVYGIGNVKDSKFLETIKLLKPAPMSGYFSVFMFHQSILELMPFNPAPSISLDDLPDGFDLYVNGHLHNRTAMELHGKPFLMPGSTVFTHMEAGFPRDYKGFYVFDTATSSYEFNVVEKFPLIKNCLRNEDAQTAKKPQKVT